MYRFITFGGVIDRQAKKVWKNKMPLKLRVFVWQALHNRLQTGVVLKKMKWKGDDKCPLCNKPETVDHIFFQCVLASFVWACFKEALGWDRVPSSLGEVFSEWILLGCSNYDIKLFSFAIIWWSFWLSRNKMRLEKKFPSQPTDVLFSIIYKLQNWGVLLQVEGRERINKYCAVLKQWTEDFTKTREQNLATDVCSF